MSPTMLVNEVWRLIKVDAMLVNEVWRLVNESLRFMNEVRDTHLRVSKPHD
jgi:hypothetical protein